MLTRLKRALRDRHASLRGRVPPWCACVRTVFCSHLRFIWHALMFLTVLCVALQLLSAVRQSRNHRSRPSDHQLIVDQQDSQSISKNSYHVTFQRFQWRDERLNHGSRPTIINVGTTPARRLTSTNRIATPSLSASKAGAPDDPKGESPVDRNSQPQILFQNFPNPKTRLSDRRRNRKQTSGFKSKIRNASCRPMNHVVFLKTHKTASSTILNILYRYGDTHNLTFALPVNMHSQLFYPHYFMSHFVEGAKSRQVTEFHIMCNHMRFRGPEVRKVMPKDTFYFSILRNPVSMMESLFTYYKAIPAFHGFRTLEDFLLDNGSSYNDSVRNNHYARNILSFDFGFNNSPLTGVAELDQLAVSIIAAIESEFHLILISEYFDESMVLLRHALCWTLEDVMSFRLNSRSEKSRKSLSAEMIEKVKQWSALDWRLYQHFNSSFWRRIDTSLGRAKLQQEVEILRARRAVLEETCLLGGKAVDPGEVHDMSLKPFQYGQAIIQGYNIRPGLDNDTQRLCQRLVTPELQYTRALYVKQFPALAAKMAALQDPPKHVQNNEKTSSSMTNDTKIGSVTQSRTDSFTNSSNPQSNNVQAAETPPLSKDNI